MAKAHRTSNSTYHIFDDIMALAGTLLRSRKDAGAEKLQSLAEATRDYAASLTDLPKLKHQVASASESLEGLADYVMHTDIEHMVADVGNFARRHPLATIGVTVAAGVIANRLLRTAPVAASRKPKRNGSKRKAKSAIRPRSGANGSAQAHA